jgi:hypothetical protein
MTLRCCQLGTVRRLDETSYMSRSVPSTFALQVAATVADGDRVRSQWPEGACVEQPAGALTTHDPPRPS